VLVLVVVLVLDLLDFCSEKGIRFPVGFQPVSRIAAMPREQPKG
jgi:hypothetical protein